jgi:uncharacterized membrane protein YoaK (UPF0700 family)
MTDSIWLRRFASTAAGLVPVACAVVWGGPITAACCAASSSGTQTFVLSVVGIFAFAVAGVIAALIAAKGDRLPLHVHIALIALLMALAFLSAIVEGHSGDVFEVLIVGAVACLTEAALYSAVASAKQRGQRAGDSY